MSYTMYVKTPICEHCKRGGDREYINDGMTWNLSPIVDAIFQLVEPLKKEGDVWSWYRFNGKMVAKMLMDMKAGRVYLRDQNRIPQWAALEPENGWGTLPTLLIEWDRMIERLEAMNQDWLVTIT